MPGGNNRSRGSRGGSRGRGKGPYRGRGRGRGGFEDVERGAYHTLEEMEEVHLVSANNQFKSGTTTPRGRGRRGSNSNSGSNTPRGRGRGNLNDSYSSKSGVYNFYNSPIGRGRGGPDDQPPKRRGGIGDSPRGRGRGRGGSKLRPDAPLSALLFQERPLLRPIKFVPSVHTRVLFEEEEEIFQAVVEEIGEEEQSHVPTADRVLRVFSGRNIPPMSLTSEDEGDKDELIEIDFNDMAQLAEIPTRPVGAEVDDVEEKFLVFEGFYIDTQPSQVDDPHQGKPKPLEDDDEEVIVYVAPHPGRVSPLSVSSAESPSLPSTSILTGTTTLASTSQPSGSRLMNTLSESISTFPQSTSPAPAPAFGSVSFSFTPTPKRDRVFSKSSNVKAKLHQRRQEAHATRRQLEQQVLFGSFGAMMEEAMLRGKSARDIDPQWGERRRGDSDVEWGEDSEEEDEGVVGLAEGMELDPDLEIDGEAMKNFVKSMGAEGSRFVTMDDIADGEVMQLEDEGGKNVESSEEDDEDEASEDDDEIDAIMDAEKAMLIAEAGDVSLEDDDESDDDDSDDEESSPRTSFQARLERLRNLSKGKGKKPAAARPKEIDEDSEEEDDDDLYDRADEDEDFIESIQRIIEENNDIIQGKDRKARNKLFRAVRDGAFDDLEDLDYCDFKPARKNKDKYKDLPLELQDPWRKDREKKAENKRLRQLKRLELAADPMSYKKGGKKGQKAMLSAAKLDPTITVLPNRVIDITTLVQQIRRFISNIGGPSSMSLPPASKETRKRVHEMALAFNLKSISKGKGDARYTTLLKTTRTGLFVDEGKVAKIVRRSMRGGGGGGEFSRSSTRGSRGGAHAMPPLHKEGEEVGKAAPKIGESNVGFKMLALMGWSEGQRIGITGGLDAPLTAVIKRSKLGLGASK
ncbi:Protein SQS1 [Termitomyces sp. J132]|nr:Protein SQS1 [Termitomyces sp. J132]